VPGFCSGLLMIMCCVTSLSTPVQPPVVNPPVNPTAKPLDSLIPVPSGINTGLNFPSPAFQTSKLGRPGCPMTPSCFSCGCPATLGIIVRNKVTRKVAPLVTVTALKPFVDAVERALLAAQAAGATNPDLMNAYNTVKTAGGLCCRPIKHSDGSAGAGYSNHSWGLAVDLYFGKDVDPRGDGKTQRGLALLAPFFNRERLYWAAGYGGSSEDAMHFEASVQLINDWMAKGLLK